MKKGFLKRYEIVIASRSSISIYFSMTIDNIIIVVIIIIIVAIIIITTRALPDSKLFFQECPRPFLQLIDITQLAFALSFIRFANMWQNWFVLRPSLWFTTGYWAVWSFINLIQPSRIVLCSWIRELLKRRFCSSWWCFFIPFLIDQPMKQLDLIHYQEYSISVPWRRCPMSNRVDLVTGYISIAFPVQTCVFSDAFPNKQPHIDPYFGLKWRKTWQYSRLQSRLCKWLTSGLLFFRAAL